MRGPKSQQLTFMGSCWKQNVGRDFITAKALSCIDNVRRAVMHLKIDLKPWVERNAESCSENSKFLLRMTVTIIQSLSIYNIESLLTSVLYPMGIMQRSERWVRDPCAQSWWDESVILPIWFIEWLMTPTQCPGTITVRNNTARFATISKPRAFERQTLLELRREWSRERRRSSSPLSCQNSRLALPGFDFFWMDFCFPK